MIAAMIAVLIMTLATPASGYASANADENAGCFSVAEKTDQQASYDPEELLVLMEKGTSNKEIRKIADDNDADLENVSTLGDGTKMALISAEDDSLQGQKIDIQLEDKVMLVQPNYKYELQASTVNDPLAYDKWYFKSEGESIGGTDAYSAWNNSLRTSDADLSEKPVVAVIDTGVRLDHEDLSGCILTDKCRTFNYGEELDFKGNDGAEDDDGHGTHVCGIIGAHRNNSIGVAGVAGNRVSIMCLDAYIIEKDEEGDRQEYFATEDIVNAISYAVSNGAKVINMSLGGLYKDLLMEKSIRDAWDNGVLCVCAAGNESTPSLASPSDSLCGISVMNHESTGKLSNSSNYGIEKDVSAPGTDIYSTYKTSNSSYRPMSGTSMAAPVVTGFAALLLSENSDLTPRQLKNLIYTSSSKREFYDGRTDSDNVSGFGRINIKNGIDNLHAMSEEIAPDEIVTNKNNIKMYVGESTGIEYEVLPANTTTADVTFTLLPTNTNVIEVDDHGMITAKSPGVAYLALECGEKTKLCKVTVEETPYKEITHKPYQDNGKFSESDPLAYINNDNDGEADEAYYMHAYKIQLEKNEIINVCMQGKNGDNYYPYVRLLSSSGETVKSIKSNYDNENKVKYAFRTYYARAAGEYTLQVIFEGTGDRTVNLSDYDYYLKIVSSKGTAAPTAELSDGNVVLSWDTVGDADGYIVRKYSDDKCNNMVSEDDITETTYRDTNDGNDYYYTVTPYVDSAAGRMRCVQSSAVKVDGEEAVISHKWSFVSFTWIKNDDGGYTAEAQYKCENDKSHKESVPALVSSEILNEADCNNGEMIKYTASVSAEESLDASNHSDTKNVKGSYALGHDWNETSYEWKSDNSEVTATRICKRDPSHIETETVKTTNETTLPATVLTEGIRTYTARFVNSAFGTQTKTAIIEKLGPTPAPDPNIEPDNNPENNGTSTDKDSDNGKAKDSNSSVITIADVEKTIAAKKNDKDIAGSKIAPMLLKSTKQTKKSIKLSWKNAPGASKYIIYGNACGKKNKLKKLAQTSGRKYTVKKVGKKLKKGKYYKFIIAAVDKSSNVVSISKMVHIATSGSKKASNPKKVTVKAKISKGGKKLKKYRSLSKTVLKRGKSLKLKTSYTKTKTKAKNCKVKKHVGMRYESSDEKVAAVTKGGKITTKAKGKAKIYVYAQNGSCKTVKITVK